MALEMPAGDAAARRRYGAILFDLFGTLLFFREHPRAGSRAPTEAQRFLVDAVRSELPGIPFVAFVGAMRDVTREMVEARRETHREYSSPERFRRVLIRLGCPADGARAERLCRAHMRGLALVAVLPPGHRELIQEWAGEFRLGVVSNFDHAATARSLLDRFGLTQFLDPIVISDEFGWRKPCPGIFTHAVSALELPLGAVLFVGDTPLDDIHGARGAGLDAAWVNWRNEAFPPDLKAPTLVVESLHALRHALVVAER